MLSGFDLNSDKTLIVPLLAAFFYGGWAYLVNMTDTAIISFYIQATGSFLITLSLKLAVDSVLGFFLQSRKSLQVLLVSSISWSFVGALMIVHYSMGSKNIFLIVMPSLIISWSYCLILLYLKRRALK